MRDPNRLYKFYSELTKIHIKHYPDLRFGQFICNFFDWLDMKTKKIDPFFLEENELLRLLKEYVKEEKMDINGSKYKCEHSKYECLYIDCNYHVHSTGKYSCSCEEYIPIHLPVTEEDAAICMAYMDI